MVGRVLTDRSDILITFVGQSGSILLDGQHGYNIGIERVSFADGTVWNLAQLSARYVSDQQTAGNDTIWGTYLAKSLDCGAGNDRLEGGSGYDTYVYSIGNGDDVIYDNGRPGPTYGSDILVFSSGITANNIVLSRVTSDRMDIRITISGQPGSILFDDQNAHNAGIEGIAFADGTI